MPAVQTALVIGGGIAGPVAATALAMAGIDATVCEARVPDPTSANGIGGSLALEPSRSGWAPRSRLRARSSWPAACATCPVRPMNIEKTMAAEQRYTINWNAPAQEDAKALA